MKFETARSLLALPIAFLGIVFLLSSFVHRQPVSVGLPLILPHLKPVPLNTCPDDRSIVIQIRKDGSTWINETPVPQAELRERLRKIFEYRQKGETAFLLTDPDIPYQRFMEVYAQVQGAVDGLHIALITPKMEPLEGQCPPDGVCGLFWPDQGAAIDCVIDEPVPVIRFPLKSPLIVNAH